MGTILDFNGGNNGHALKRLRVNRPFKAAPSVRYVCHSPLYLFSTIFVIYDDYFLQWRIRDFPIRGEGTESNLRENSTKVKKGSWGEGRISQRSAYDLVHLQLHFSDFLKLRFQFLLKSTFSSASTMRFLFLYQCYNELVLCSIQWDIMSPTGNYVAEFHNTEFSLTNIRNGLQLKHCICSITYFVQVLAVSFSFLGGGRDLT